LVDSHIKMPLMLFFSALILILFFDTQDFLGAFFGSAPLAVGCLEMLVPAFRKGYFITSSVSWLSRKRPMLGFFLDGEILGESFLFLVILLGDHDALQVLGVDHPAVDLELTEGVVDLVGGELLTPGHQRVPEHFGVNLSVDFEGFE